MSYYAPKAGEVEEFVKKYCEGKIKARGNELAAQHCPFCNGKGEGNEYTFTINVTTGQYQCKRASCRANSGGNMVTLSKEFGFELEDEDYKKKIAEAAQQARVKQKRLLFSSIPKRESTPRAIEYLKSRGISEEVCRKYEITSKKDDENIIVFPFRSAEDDSVKFVKYRNTLHVKGETEGPKEWAESGLEPILFGMNHCDTGKSLIVVTEGQIDALSVATAIDGINVVSVPNGCNAETWVMPCKAFMSYFGEIIVFGDYERKLDRITLVEMMTKNFRANIKCVRKEDYLGETKDANEILQQYGPEQIKRCIENAELVKSDDIVDITDIKPTSESNKLHVMTGIYQIDKCLRGGIPSGGTTIITGDTGSGKTTITTQILSNALNEGYKCFVYSGEIATEDTKLALYMHLAGSKVQVIGINSFGDREYGIADSDFNDIEKWLKGKCYVRNQEAALINLIDEANEEIEKLSVKVVRALRQYGCRFFLIDNLLTAMDEEMIRSDDVYTIQSKFIKKMTALAQRFNLFMIIVSHKNKGNSSGIRRISGSADIGNLASVVIDYSKKDGDDNEEIREMAIIKNRMRHGKLIDKIALEFDEGSARVWGTGDPEDYLKSKTYDWETHYQGFALVDENLEDIPF